MRPLATTLLLTLALLLPGRALAAWAPPGVDLTRPRLLLRADDVAAVQAKLDTVPLPLSLDRVLGVMERNIDQAASTALGDDSKEAQRIMARAARNLAFLYAIDRTRIGGQVVPFPTPADRQAAGDRVKELLLNLYPRSRLAVPPPLGGWDRDISTSEELLGWAGAYDALAGAGYDFGDDEAAIVESIADLASELYLNYTVPISAVNFALFHQNNHRSKTGASLAMAGIALAEYEAAPGSDPDGIRDPANWIDYGVGQADMIVRVALNTGDGAYAEGPFYAAFTAENLIPFARAWDRLLGGADYAAGPHLVPSFWRHPLYERHLRWLLDMTLPDGAMVHIDDGNPGRSYFFGGVPPELPDRAAYAWRWENAPSPFKTSGNVDLGPDQIVLFDPAVVPAPPGGSPTAFYREGGNAIFRSDWSEDAVMAVALGEYDAASLFGRDRDGRGLAPQSHEHAEPGAFLLHAYGERMALDPGYFSFGSRDKVSRPEHHNMILVDGAGPIGYVGATLAWTDPYGRPPADGHGRISDTLDTRFLDAARITARYGLGNMRPVAEAPLVSRRFLFADDRYLVIADRVVSGDAVPHDFSWLLHGHGGGNDPDGSPGGSYADTSTGGRWERGAARLDAAFALAEAEPVFETSIGIHESAGSRDDATHVVLRASAAGEALTGLMLAYPSPSAQAAPAAEAFALAGAAALKLDDPAGDRRAVAFHRAAPGGLLTVPAATNGMADAASDASLALFDAASDGSLRLAYAEQATEIRYGGATVVSGARPGTLAVGFEAGAVDFLIDDGADSVQVRGLPFPRAHVDGSCGMLPLPGGAYVVTLNRERRFRLAAAPGNSRPAADAGPDLRLPLGFDLRLDGRASCDSDGDALTARWRILSAPTQHGWALDDPTSFTPRLLLDRPGIYRLELVVTDAHGLESRPDEVVVLGGWSCLDGIDDDLDGLIDADDPTCADGAETVFRWPEGCGLGPELLPLLGALLGLRRRRGRHATQPNESSASAMPRSPATE